MRRVTLATKGVTFIPGRRYLANTKTGVTYPYNEAFAKNPDMQEIFPEFKETTVAAPEPEVQEVPLDEPVEFDPIIVEVPATPSAVETPANEPEPAEKVNDEPAKANEAPNPPKLKPTPQERMEHARNAKYERKGK